MKIDRCDQFNLALSKGSHAWPGGYEIFFLCADGEPLCWEAAAANAGLIRNAIISGDKYSSWCVVGADINWEDDDLYCVHTGRQIKPEYGD